MPVVILPALVCLVHSPQEEPIKMVYDLRHVSPAYFLQELDRPTKPRRPQGVQSIVPDNLRSIITVKATPAAHTALKLALAQLDVEPSAVQPTLVFLFFQGKKDGKVVLEIPLWSEVNKPLSVGIQFNAAEVAEQEKRPLACRVPVKPEVNLIVTPHLSADGKTVRLEQKLERTKPKAETISLPDLMVIARQRTTIKLGDAFQELSVIASPDAPDLIYRQSGIEIRWPAP